MQVRERAKKTPEVLETAKIQRDETKLSSKFVTMAQAKIKLQQINKKTKPTVTKDQTYLDTWFK